MGRPRVTKGGMVRMTCPSLRGANEGHGPGRAGDHVEIVGDHMEITGDHMEISGSHMEISGDHVEISGAHMEIAYLAVARWLDVDDSADVGGCSGGGGGDGGAWIVWSIPATCHQGRWGEEGMPRVSPREVHQGKWGEEGMPRGTEGGGVRRACHVSGGM